MVAGPQEATLLGNLGVQFLAKGCFRDFSELGHAILDSFKVTRYDPES